MSTTLATQAGRTADRIAPFCVAMNAAMVAFGFFLTDQSGSRSYLLLAVFAALGVVGAVVHVVGRVLLDRRVDRRACSLSILGNDAVVERFDRHSRIRWKKEVFLHSCVPRELVKR